MTGLEAQRRRARSRRLLRWVGWALGFVLICQFGFVLVVLLA